MAIITVTLACDWTALSVARTRITSSTRTGQAAVRAVVAMRTFADGKVYTHAAVCVAYGIANVKTVRVHRPASIALLRALFDRASVSYLSRQQAARALLRRFDARLSQRAKATLSFRPLSCAVYLTRQQGNAFRAARTLVVVARTAVVLPCRYCTRKRIEGARGRSWYTLPRHTISAPPTSCVTVALGTARHEGTLGCDLHEGKLQAGFAVANASGTFFGRIHRRAASSAVANSSALWFHGMHCCLIAHVEAREIVNDR